MNQMTTQQILQQMSDQVKVLNRAINGVQLEKMNIELSKMDIALLEKMNIELGKMDIALRDLKIHCQNLTAILDECDSIQPGIVSNAAIVAYRKMTEDETKG